MRFSRTPAVLRWPGPKIGEHNDYVLGELLGYDARRIEELNGGGAFGKVTG